MSIDLRAAESSGRGLRASLRPEGELRLRAVVRRQAAATGTAPSAGPWRSIAGSRVELWATGEDALRLLGPIDTPDEALYALQLLGELDVDCAAPEPYEVRPVQGGYEVRVWAISNRQ